MRSLRALALFSSLTISSTALCACELVADFDRGKLDSGTPKDAGNGPTTNDDAGDSEDAGTK